MSATHSRFGRGGEERAVDEVLADPDAGHADRRPAALAGDQPGDAGLAHQPLHALAADPLAVVEDQLGVDARRAIDPAVARRGSRGCAQQPRVLDARAPTAPGAARRESPSG